MRNDKLEHCHPVDRRYLFAALDISRTGFYVHRADWPSQSDDKFVTHVTSQGRHAGIQVLRDTGGTIAGVLDVHDPDYDTVFHGPGGAEDAAVRTSVELVAISRGQTLKMHAPYPECEAQPEWRDWRNNNWQDDWYKFYSVIWVGWRVDDGMKVAERRGIGRVSRDVWEAAQNDTEDIVLS
ncbi:hypothetical protein GE09DRAFT_1161224 [Coniochaeta sp. 2T2.1]|nr:hypothetical protein GE09DRAFT_1161224 [Coniochaeta sp. 2T2.1]